jgi:hypothetical protein
VLEFVHTLNSHKFMGKKGIKEFTGGSMETGIEKSSTPPIPIAMYKVPGHGDIDPEKYLRNKEQDNLIKSAAEQDYILHKILHAPEKERVSLIEQALSQENLEVQIEAVKMIKYAPEQKRASLIKIAFDLGLGNEVVKPPLYNKSDLDKQRFKRQPFKKTGSETTLVGGPLKDKLIIRHIKPRAFLAWQKIYENYQVWRDNGFDYVPIEPIQSYRFNKKRGLVEVFSGVLDLSLAEWLRVSGGMFEKELTEQKNKIISILESQGIEHGHLHDNNFVLRFFRDQNGNPDLNQVPRLYVIDFDAAVSP